MKELDWFGAYNSSLKGVIADEAFQHPAKFSYGLIVRIYTHLLERGWLREGDLVADPFAGVGVGGIVAAANGLYWIGCELEQKFVELAEDSFSLHVETWERMGKPRPVVLQGDSRQFSSVIREVSGIITSPPFGSDNANLLGRTDKSATSVKATTGMRGIELSADNIGAMKVGKLDEVIAVITSPPYGRDVEPHRAKPMEEWRGTKKWGGPHSVVRAQGYPRSEGQLGGMPEGDHAEVVDACITSPPFETTDQRGAEREYSWERRTGKPFGAGKSMRGYPDSEGQIGQEQGSTYWYSCVQVYSECYEVLRGDGVMAVVVKSFIRKGKVIDLPGQTFELLEVIGFEPLERIRAWMTSPATQKSLMPDIRPDYTKAKKSFFRRLYEKKYPENAIDFEEVLIVRKPL